MLTSATCRTVMAARTLEPLPVGDGISGGKRLRFEGGPGLYQFSVFLDAAGFDWESLYQTLNVFHNANERTGPWDFDLETARPRVPSYWVRLNGRTLGLWSVQRISLDDLTHRRFRGRCAFAIAEAGMHELCFEPYRPDRVEWVAARLEPDPEDVLAVGLRPLHPVSALPDAAWAEPEFWRAQRRKLETTHAVYHAPIEALLDWLRSSPSGDPPAVVLAAGWHLGGNEDARRRALADIDRRMALPAWGRLDPEAYGHNGDIGAAATLRDMSSALHAFGPQLGKARRDELVRKLSEQGERLFEQILLTRDYWGGSLLQDHGRQAVHDFGAAAMSLWGIVPEAERWVAYIVPRIDRGLDAAPRDGVIPGSSYNGLHLYTDRLMDYRDTLRARTGRDLLDHPSLAGVADFANTVRDETGSALRMVEAADLAPLKGGAHFLEAMSAARGDAPAAALAACLRHRPHERLQSGGATAAASVLRGFLAHEPSRRPPPAAARPPRDLRVFDDSGFVHYRDDETGMALSLKCGPWLGYHAQRHAAGPCDGMEMLPAGGHFALFVDGLPRLVSPDTGYRLRSAVRSCLLVDGRGQIGDVGYPMSIPSQPHRGEHIDSVRWDPATGVGVVRLNLCRAYPSEAGMAQYLREFHFAPERGLLIRDHVTLYRPRRLSWLFHFHASDEGRMQGLEGCLASGRPVRMAPHAAGCELQGAIAPTHVVYSYASRFHRFQHFRYDTVSPVASASVEFAVVAE